MILGGAPRTRVARGISAISVQVPGGKVKVAYMVWSEVTLVKV